MVEGISGGRWLGGCRERWAVIFETICISWLTLALVCTKLQAQEDARAAVQQVVDGAVQPFLQQTGAPGAIVGVSLHRQRYYFAYGQARDDGTAFTQATEVEIGSCTKVFTTTLFALAVNRHQMGVDDTAQRYMPAGYHLQPAAQVMTVRELANFTSGLPDNATDLPPQLEQRSIEHYTTKDFLHWISRWQPTTSLPAPYLYSNAGVGLLGYLVETATGKPWQAQLNSEILAPLGMADTAMQPGPDQMSRMAQGHRPNGAPAPAWPIYAWYAAGVLRSTAVDMVRFGEANLGHTQVDGRTVSPELIAAMKLAQAPTYDLPNGEARQGMAWVTNVGTQPGLAPEVLKNGGTAGFSTAILTNERKDAVVFIAINKGKANPVPLAMRIGRHLP